jgi:hypothetical protein
MKKYNEARIINELGDAIDWIEQAMDELETTRLLLHRVQFNLLEGESDGESE